MARVASCTAVVALAFAAAACGGGGGDSGPDHAGVDAFSDVLEIARAELGDTASLHEVSVSETEISFVNFQAGGRNIRVKYDTNAVAAGNEPVQEPLNPLSTFSIADVPNTAPATILAAIEEREGGDVADFTVTLSRNRRGELAWRARATVDGEPRQYIADLSGALR